MCLLILNPIVMHATLDVARGKHAQSSYSLLPSNNLVSVICFFLISITTAQSMLILNSTQNTMHFYLLTIKSSNVLISLYSSIERENLYVVIYFGTDKVEVP